MPSEDAPTTRRELGSKCAALMFAAPSSTVTGIPSTTSATTTVLSALAVSTSFDVRSNSSDRIGLWRGLSWLRSVPDSASQICSAPSWLAVTTSWPLGENATASIDSPTSRR
jgi:hypothetical protein